jgi:hypothetical protein
MKRLAAALLLALTTSGCFPLYIAERMAMDIEAQRAYHEYCRYHYQECVDAYHRSLQVYVH